MCFSKLYCFFQHLLVFIKVYFVLLTTSQEEEMISSCATLPGYSDLSCHIKVSKLHLLF